MESIICDTNYSDFKHCRGLNKNIINSISFRNLEYKNKIYLLHITSNFKNILDTRSLYASTGCMIGGIYSTPLYFDDKRGLFRMHNLGVRYEYEINKIAKANNNNLENIANIIIEIDVNNTQDYICGINYLKGGKNHYNCILNMLNMEKYEAIKQIFKHNINTNFKDSTTINKLLTLNKNDLINFINTVSDKYPILSFIYFEAFSIAYMLNDKSIRGNAYVDNNELYNFNYKHALFLLYPEFFKQFNLAKFNPSYKDLRLYFSNKKFIDFDTLYEDLLDILEHLIKDSLFDFSKPPIENIFDLDDDFVSFVYPFIGHQMRLIKINSEQFLDFKTQFHKNNANNLWNILNKKNKMLCYNSIIPKGELTVNPCFSNNIKLYLGALTKNRNENFFYLKQVNELNVTAKSDLVENKFIVMNSHKININKQ